MTTVFLVHGWADASGKKTTDLLRPYFEAEGYEVEEFDTGFQLFVSHKNAKWAQQLTERVKPGDIGCGHSNGCAILQRASMIGAPFSQLVFINPALDKDAKVGPQIKACHVWYSRFDIGLRIVKYFPWSEWGSMGAEGPTGTFPPFIKYDKSSAPFDTKSGTHLDMFLPEQLAYFGPRIVGEVTHSLRRHESYRNFHLES